MLTTTTNGMEVFTNSTFAVREPHFLVWENHTMCRVHEFLWANLMIDFYCMRELRNLAVVPGAFNCCALLLEKVHNKGYVL